VTLKKPVIREIKMSDLEVIIPIAILLLVAMSMGSSTAPPPEFGEGFPEDYGDPYYLQMGTGGGEGWGKFEGTEAWDVVVTGTGSR